ncbi:cobalt-precorrin-6A reductase [Rhodococcus triatomae]
MRRVLILGGTSEGRALAESLDMEPGLDVVSSLAGRVADPRLPVGAVRIGGFGGVGGLADWLRENDVDAVVDATHPFASRITTNAVAAARDAGVPLLVLRRPEWVPGVGDRWHAVPDLGAAATAASALGRRVLLTIGRQGVDAFAEGSAWFLIRAIDPPTVAVPPRSEVLLARGPFTVDDEIATMRQHRIDVLVTKNSGGALTAAKLEAARTLGLPVVMVSRPGIPASVAVTSDIEQARTWAARAD